MILRMPKTCCSAISAIPKNIVLKEIYAAKTWAQKFYSQHHGFNVRVCVGTGSGTPGYNKLPIIGKKLPGLGKSLDNG